MVTGLSKIKNTSLQLISDNIDPNSGHHHDSKLDHDQNHDDDLEAYGAAASLDHFNDSITSSSSSPFHLPTPSSTPSSPPDDFQNPICDDSCQSQKAQSNPIAEVASQQAELGKSFLSFILPLITFLLTVPMIKDSSPLVVPSTLCLICAALVSLFYGNSLRDMFPKLAHGFEQFGTACVYTSVFIAIGSHLPPTLTWVPLICFLACLLLSIYNFITVCM